MIHSFSIWCAAPMPKRENKKFILGLLAIFSLMHEHAMGQASSSGVRIKLAANTAAAPAKEALVEVYHTSGRNGEVLLAGRAHKRAPNENLQVELAFQSESGPIAIALPLKRITADTARFASFGFETAVHGLPQIAPSDPRHSRPFFAIHLTDRGGRYYEEESYAEFISSAEKPVAVPRVIELPAQSLWAGVRRPKRPSHHSATAPAFTLKAERPNREVCALEWTALPNAAPSAQTLSLVFRNERHLAITFARRFVDQAGTLSPNTTYRVEQIGKDGMSASSNTVGLPGASTSSSPLDTGGLYAASHFVERTPEALATVVTKHNAAIQHCYQRELKLNPSLKGELRVRIVISARGSVDSVSVVSSTLKSPAVEDCVVGRIKRWNDFGQSDPAKREVAIKQTYVFGY
jgi:hypothetical protein